MSSNLFFLTSFSSSFGSFVCSLSSQSSKSVSLLLCLKSSLMFSFDSLLFGFKFSLFSSKSCSGSFLFLLGFSCCFLSQSLPFFSISLRLSFCLLSFPRSFCSKLSNQSLLSDFLLQILFLLFSKSLCLFSSSLSFFSFFLSSKSSLFIIFSFSEC